VLTISVEERFRDNFVTLTISVEDKFRDNFVTLAISVEERFRDDFVTLTISVEERFRDNFDLCAFPISITSVLATEPLLNSRGRAAGLLPRLFH